MSNKKEAESIYSGGDVSEIYKKLEHKQHVLQLPDTYIGSIDNHEDELYVLNTESDGAINIRKNRVNYIPGLISVFNEILVNVTDQWTRLRGLNKKGVKLLTEIRVNINKDTGEISIQNDGDGIDAAIIPKYGKYPVELIFGELLTSTNYNKKEQKVVGGKNGYGAKLTNIFSTRFTVESVDRFRKKLVRVDYHNNMLPLGEPVVTKWTKEPYTKITFVPDFKRFGIECLTDDIVNIMMKRVYDASAWTDETVTVYLNDKAIPTKSFRDYVNLYLGDSDKYPRIHQKINQRWEVIATVSKDDHFEQVSFVNGINTFRGGKHVNYVLDQIRNHLIEVIKKKSKMRIRPQCIKDQLMIFLKAQIVNPSFDSQTKETLTTNIKKFGSTCEIPKKFVDELVKNTDVIDRIINLMEFKNSKSLNKTDGCKRTRIKVPKLDDANWAGGSKSKRCTLILTEGDSAKSMAIAGLSIVGRDQYGVFPLRGKMLNVKDADIEKIGKNKEINYLKQILGLKANADYDTSAKVWPLRYGKIMVMTDQDVDGSHIKGLLFNIFHNMWPSLLKDDFMTSMITPIVKVTKGKKQISFYNKTHYLEWKEKHNNGKGWSTKYYKGLGTSTTKEAKEYFKELRVVNYKFDDENKSNDSIDLAFNKKRTDDRKMWLQNYDYEKVLDPDSLEVEYADFIHKELIHFSNEDLSRSIPSICDGLKPSQRKILYCGFKRNLKKEIKVAQLSGYVSEHSAYHHGEVSLQMAIIGMAQDYVGSNNINLFMPNGQFGTRLLGGKDSASPRYIFTALSPISMNLYNSQDFPLLDYLEDDGLSVEPRYYLPIIPMILINGAQGIGTGYSTSIPNHNPMDIIKLIHKKLDGKDISDIEIKPWFRNFKGTIEKKSKGNGFISKGKYRFVNITTLEITELPVGVWTEDYKEFLDSILIDTRSKTKMKMKTKTTVTSKQFLKSYQNYSTESDVRFVLKFTPTILNNLKNKKTSDPDVNFLEKKLKLATTKSTNYSNMHLYNGDGSIQKYTKIHEIVDEFYDLRLQMYKDRKDYIVHNLQFEVDVLEAKVRYIEDVVNEKYEIRNVSEKALHTKFEELEYPKFDLSHKKDDPMFKPSYDYLNMRMNSLTTEKIIELQELCKKKQMELAEIKGKVSEDIWREDLSSLEKMYKKYYVKKRVVLSSGKSVKKTKKTKKSAVTKTKKIKLV